MGRENILHNEDENNVLGEALVEHILKIMELLVNHGHTHEMVVKCYCY